jgi:hypothetical protein
VRHSSPYGFRQSTAADRDLRAYCLGSIHDLTIVIRLAEPGAA